MIDWEKSEKLPPDRRYFNISIIWIFYFRYAIRLFYHLKIPHEVLTLLSIVSGAAAAVYFKNGLFIAGAVLLHIKDIFDASDGAVARLTGRGHLIGRYLDSLGDFFVLHLVVIGIVIHAWQDGRAVYVYWGTAALLSIFIQCSFFNFYQLAYLKYFGIDRLSSKQDETARDDIDRDRYRGPARILLAVFRGLYLVVFSWQDRLVAAVDRSLYRRAGMADTGDWYGDKLLMILQSALCFGTHIFVIIVFAVFGHPEYSLIFISTFMNLYLVWLLLYRRYRLAVTRDRRSPGSRRALV